MEYQGPFRVRSWIALPIERKAPDFTDFPRLRATQAAPAAHVGNYGYVGSTTYLEAKESIQQV